MKRKQKGQGLVEYGLILALIAIVVIGGVTTLGFKVVSQVETTTAELSFVSVKDYGAIGDGLTDDTTAIQAALDANDYVMIPDGTYLINVDTSLKPKNNQTLRLSSSTILQAIPTTTGTNAIINISAVNDVTISGGVCVGDRYTHLGSTGTWGMGLRIEKGSTDINISNMTFKDCWGDGIYMGASPAVSYVTIDNIISDNNRRQGMSITNANNIVIKNSTFKNTAGTNPQSGIDIEPNSGETTTDIQITDTKCIGNAGYGISLMGLMSTIENIELDNVTLNDNVAVGLKLVNASGLSCENIQIENNGIGIDVSKDLNNVLFKNTNILNNQKRGVSLVVSGQAVGSEKITFDTCLIANNSKQTAGSYDGVKIGQLDSTGYIKNVKFKNTRLIDDQPVHTQRYGISADNKVTITDILIYSDCVFSGNTVGGMSGPNPAVLRLVDKSLFN